MKSTKGRIAVILIAFICLFANVSNRERAAWACPACGRKGNTGKYCGNCAHPAPEAAPAYAVGDIITFGHYEQDNNLDNGSEAIEWIVLDYDTEEKKVLLLSRYGLDAKRYHEHFANIIKWEECTLRNWLNEEFLTTAFTADEQEKILKTNVDNSRSQGYSGWYTDGGNDTEDQIFLLSYREVFEEYFKNNKSRTCQPTAYAIAQGSYIDYSSGNWRWLLRSPGDYPNRIAAVDIDGSRSDASIYNEFECVRPALWLNLDTGIL